MKPRGAGTGSPLVPGLVVALALVLTCAAAAFGWKPLVMAAMTGQYRRNQSPAIRAFPEGLNVVLIGTGSPMGDISREGACIAVVAGKRTFIVDAGEGANRNIQIAKIPTKPDALLLTHFHSDHIASLGDIALGHWSRNVATGASPRDRPARCGVRRQGVQRSVQPRRRLPRRPPWRGMDASLGSGKRREDCRTRPGRGRVGGLVFEEDGLRVTMFRVDHGAVKPAVGYRFDYRGRSVALSGDTRYSESVVGNAAGVDILFNEALSPRMVAVIEDYASNPSSAKIAHDIPDYHSSPEDAARMAAGAGAGMLALYHIIPPVTSPVLYPVFLGDAGKHFRRQITIGADGMMFNLPPDSKRVRQTRRFRK